jgi:hypothetical protein
MVSSITPELASYPTAQQSEALVQVTLLKLVGPGGTVCRAQLAPPLVVAMMAGEDPDPPVAQQSLGLAQATELSPPAAAGTA